MYPGCVVEGDYITFPLGVYMKYAGALLSQVHVWALDTDNPIVRVTDEEWVREWVRRTPGVQLSTHDYILLLPAGYTTVHGRTFLHCDSWGEMRIALGGVTLTLPYKPMEG